MALYESPKYWNAIDSRNFIAFHYSDSVWESTRTLCTLYRIIFQNTGMHYINQNKVILHIALWCKYVPSYLFWVHSLREPFQSFVFYSFNLFSILTVLSFFSFWKLSLFFWNKCFSLRKLALLLQETAHFFGEILAFRSVQDLYLIF